MSGAVERGMNAKRTAALNLAVRCGRTLDGATWIVTRAAVTAHPGNDVAQDRFTRAVMAEWRRLDAAGKALASCGYTWWCGDSHGWVSPHSSWWQYSTQCVNILFPSIAAARRKVSKIR